MEYQYQREHWHRSSQLHAFLLESESTAVNCGEFREVQIMSVNSDAFLVLSLMRRTLIGVVIFLIFALWQQYLRKVRSVNDVTKPLSPHTAQRYWTGLLRKAKAQSEGVNISVATGARAWRVTSWGSVEMSALTTRYTVSMSMTYHTRLLTLLHRRDCERLPGSLWQ